MTVGYSTDTGGKCSLINSLAVLYLGTNKGKPSGIPTQEIIRLELDIHQEFKWKSDVFAISENGFASGVCKQVACRRRNNGSASQGKAPTPQAAEHLSSISLTVS